MGAAAAAGFTKQSLFYAENLVIPQEQVVVIRANMRCNHCRQRVSHMVSKMKGGLLEYVVDVGKKEVALRGAVSKKKKLSNRDTWKSSKCWWHYKLMCFGN